MTRKPVAKTAAAKKSSTPKKAPTRTRAGATTKKAAAPRTRGAAAEARAKKVLELRASGTTLAEIARRLKFRDAAAAHAAYEKALASSLPPTPEEARRTEIAQLDQRQEDLLPLAMTGDLQAVQQLLEVAVERSRFGVVLVPDAKGAGPTETATIQEIANLGRGNTAPALCAAATVLAREVDDARERGGEPGLVATAARELRMTMSQLRGLAMEVPPPAQTGSEKKSNEPADPVVVEAARLEGLRKKAGRA